jgi:hypothetical protein
VGSISVEVPFVFMSRYMPCPACGESLPRGTESEHACDPQRRASYQMLSLREEVAGFDASWRAHLNSAPGRFETWLAARQVRRTR